MLRHFSTTMPFACTFSALIFLTPSLCWSDEAVETDDPQESAPAHTQKGEAPQVEETVAEENLTEIGGEEEFPIRIPGIPGSGGSEKDIAICAAMGGVIGQLFKAKDASKYGVLAAAAACAMAAYIVERERKKFLERERKLNEEIARQEDQNARLRQENARLERQIEEMEEEAAELQTLANRRIQRAARIAARIEGRQQAAPEIIENLREQIEEIEEQIASGTLSAQDEAAARERITNLEERIALQERIIAIQI